MKALFLLGCVAAGVVTIFAQEPRPVRDPVVVDERVKARVDEVRAKVERMRIDARINAKIDAALGASSDESYRRAGRLLDERQYEKALDAYQHVVESTSPRAEGALYWKAYALGKLGRTAEATAALDELRKKYPASHWLNDAKALELEVRQSAGMKASPEAENDEDLKLLALNGLIGTDPDRVIPQVEKILASAKSSPKLKERALFVMAQSKNAKARDMLVKYARGGANPDLQLKAVEYLGAQGGKEDRALLGEIYQSNSDLAIRRAVLHSYVAAHDSEALMQVARTEQNATLRADAIRNAAVTGVDVWPLYAGGSAPVETRTVIAQALMMRGDLPHLAEIARTDKDVKLRREAIRYLGSMSRAKSADLLVGMYAAESDKETRTAILDAFVVQQNAKALIDVARKETDGVLKRDAVRRLTSLKTPEANEYLMELLDK